LGGMSMGGRLNNPSGFQQGMILQWYGTIATIPSGWQLCNGANGTPDLRNKFIVCANADSGGLAKTTITGVATQSDATPFHYHNCTVSISSGGSIAAGADYDSSASGVSGANIDVALPPYYALAYIMKL